MSIFKAYDIRGIVPDQLDPALARRIGRAFADHLGGGRILVGRDMRTHSPDIAGAVIEGLTSGGADVVDIGLSSTPMTYFAIGSHDVDGGLCVTASHNPGEYNGMKLCSRGAKPISRATGIAELEAACSAEEPAAAAAPGGRPRRWRASGSESGTSSSPGFSRSRRLSNASAKRKRFPWCCSIWATMSEADLRLIGQRSRSNG